MKSETYNTLSTATSVRARTKQSHRNAMETGFVTQATYQESDEGKEHPKGESLTEPDMTLPIPEIMRRATQGIKPQINTPVYGDGDLDDTDYLRLQHMDMVEREDHKSQVTQRLRDLEQEASSVPSEVKKDEQGMKPAQ